MKLQLNASAVLALAGVTVAGLVLWRVGKAAPQAIKDAANAVNPLNPDNVFAGGVNAVGGAIVTDPAGPGKNADGGWSLGAWLYDVTSGDNARINEMLKGTPEPARFGGVTSEGW